MLCILSTTYIQLGHFLGDVRLHHDDQELLQPVRHRHRRLIPPTVAQSNSKSIEIIFVLCYINCYGYWNVEIGTFVYIFCVINYY